MLRTLAAEADRTNEYFEVERPRQLQAALSSLPDGALAVQRFNLNWELGPHLLRLGQEREAVEQILQADELLPQVRGFLSDKQHRQLLMDLAVACLRLGEAENCIHCQTGRSCLLPIRGEGVHRRPEGSRAAAR